MEQHAEEARKNSDVVKNVHKTHDHIKEVDYVIEIDYDSDSYSNYDEDDDYIPKMVKTEDSDSRDEGYKVDPEKNQYGMLI